MWNASIDATALLWLQKLPHSHQNIIAVGFEITTILQMYQHINVVVTGNCKHFHCILPQNSYGSKKKILEKSQLHNHLSLTILHQALHQHWLPSYFILFMFNLALKVDK